ncbi:hypothetical protein GR925_15365 [Streptomyces sp. HUCO-GS316]|uniref:hypothetical protein n=1 Tax=Streptomyces sp. HUCO-GS316 TaxID=2692198 RepID=UPI00136A395E|nr:hypothetical protein [Streptomyces sp. HUCO-GS316]MXM64785.1 hypothetical protein [Streptomyces sp. HUCO-GS316]
MGAPHPPWPHLPRLFRAAAARLDGYVVTLGQTAVQLDRPMLLTWRPGQFGRCHVTEPGEVDAQRLVRVAGRVLGPGCVMSDSTTPVATDRTTGTDRPA